jgi:hypothetical protein
MKRVLANYKTNNSFTKEDRMKCTVVYVPEETIESSMETAVLDALSKQVRQNFSLYGFKELVK